MTPKHVYRIESAIPIPTRDCRSKYPLDRLLPGDSFFVPTEPGCTVQRVRTRVAVAVNQFKKTGGAPGRTFTLRIVDGGVRVWRIV